MINPIHRNSFGKWLGKIIKVGKIEEWWDYIVTFPEKEDGHYAFNESDLELDEVSRRYNNLKKLYGEPK